MRILHSSQIPTAVPDWATQLAELTRLAWASPDGHSHFPYLPLTQRDEWLTQVAEDWATGVMHSWVVLHDGQICSHAALLNKGTHWELGRLVAHKAPRGATHEMCKVRLKHCQASGIHARMECTQAHTRAQNHAARVGMRFAGIGFLEKIDGVDWDIIFFDTLEAPAFIPQPGILADPLGVVLHCMDSDKVRLRQINHILTTDVGGVLPPTRFHVLPKLIDTVRRIIQLNVV